MGYLYQYCFLHFVQVVEQFGQDVEELVEPQLEVAVVEVEFGQVQEL